MGHVSVLRGPIRDAGVEQKLLPSGSFSFAPSVCASSANRAIEAAVKGRGGKRAGGDTRNTHARESDGKGKGEAELR